MSQKLSKKKRALRAATKPALTAPDATAQPTDDGAMSPDAQALETMRQDIVRDVLNYMSAALHKTLEIAVYDASMSAAKRFGCL